MAGSFNLFRRYQKAALAGLAIMAMLAFFVLPPLLQMGSSGAGPGDGTVVRWQGGGLRESGLQRAVIIRQALNRFLMALQAAATGNERVQPPLLGDEGSVVNDLLLAREAEANGIVVSDAVINDFLGMWTGDMVTAPQIQSVISQLQDRAGVTEADIFNALRTVILGERLQTLMLQGTGYSGTPPGWRWDAFRKLEQGATVEVVPVVVESLAAEVPTPSQAALESLYAAHRDDLPRARSATPGFRQPARIRYDAVVAPADLFMAESEAKVADEEIEKFYEANKDSLFRKRAEEPKPDAPAEPAPDASDTKPEESKPDPTAPEGEKPAAAADPAEAPKATEPAQEPGDSPVQDSEPATSGDSVARRRGSFLPAAFRQPAAEPGDAADKPATDDKPATADKPATEDKPATDDKPATAGDPPAEETVEYEPLEKVRDEIRKRLAAQLAGKRLSEAFSAITARVSKYSDDVELAIGMREPVPPPPDVMKLAAEHGLEGVRSEFLSVTEAISAGGIGRSFEISSERSGVPQQRWLDLMFGPEARRFRPATTFDVAGVRYLSWKTEDRPQFTPPLAEIKDEVERVWRLIEARPLARKRAEELAKGAESKPLAEAVAGRDGLQASTVGPFTWLTRGTAPFGSPPMRSDPEGIEMAGDDFLARVFALEPGGTTTAFNEPQTICYAIRLVTFEPPDDTLQARFLDAAADPRRLAALAEDETRDAYARWMAGIQKRHGVEWLRDPR